MVSVYVKQKEWEIGWKVWTLHCFAGEQWQDVVLLVDRSDCQTAAVWWVSMKQREWKMKQKGRDITLFCFRVLARCCAPSSSIRLPTRLSLVSVYVKQKQSEIRWRGRNVTLFCLRALARCCAPCGPIRLCSRVSVVSVYVKQKEWEMGWKVWMLHCFVGEQWQDVVLLVDRSDCSQCSVWWVSMWNKKNKRWDEKYGCYIVLLENSGKMLCSFITDLIGGEVQCGECLCETKRMRDSMKR
jgi:hypothetical protein